MTDIAGVELTRDQWKLLADVDARRAYRTAGGIPMCRPNRRDLPAFARKVGTDMAALVRAKLVADVPAGCTFAPTPEGEKRLVAHLAGGGR